VYFFRVGRNFDSERTRRSADHALYADAGWQAPQIAGVEPLCFAGGGIEIADFPFQHKLVFGNFRVPVRETVITGIIEAKNHLEARVAHEGVRIPPLEITYQEQVPERLKRLVLRARQPAHRAS
jgi:hypothetical protein